MEIYRTFHNGLNQFLGSLTRASDVNDSYNKRHSMKIYKVITITTHYYLTSTRVPVWRYKVSGVTIHFGHVFVNKQTTWAITRIKYYFLGRQVRLD